MRALAEAGGGPGSVVGTVIFVIALIGGYWAPTIVAFVRHIPAKSQVVVMNLFLGWTGVGWVVALFWALRAIPPQPAAQPQVLRPPNGV